MFPWARISAMDWTSLHTSRWESQPNNFPFPSWELILGRCLALLAQCKEPLSWLTGTRRHLAHGNLHAGICPRPMSLSPHQICNKWENSGFSLEKFPVQVHGSFPMGLLKAGLLASPTVTTSMQNLPSCGCCRITAIAGLPSNKADSIRSSLRCQLFSVPTSSLGSIRIKEEAEN